MRNTHRIESRNLNDFLESLARVLGIPRRELNKFVYGLRGSSFAPRPPVVKREVNRQSELAVR